MMCENVRTFDGVNSRRIHIVKMLERNVTINEKDK